MMNDPVIDYRARSLHPRFAIDLHRERLFRRDAHLAALGQPLAGRSQSGPHLAHVQAILQADDLDFSVAEI